MKKYLLALLFAGLSFPCLADDGTNDCHIDGTETMDAVVVMNATSNAPAGAAGVAKIESENEDGNTTAHLEIKAFGLDPGQYDLSVTLISTSSNVDLGLFDSSWHSEHQDDLGIQVDVGASAWISADWGGCTNWGSWTNWSNTNFTCGGTWGKWFGHSHDDNENDTNSTVTEIEVDLPAGIDPADIGEITISDTNGAPILVGDLTNPAPGTVVNISGTVQIAAGPAAPGLTGTAQVQSTVNKGKWQHNFTLTATGAAAKTTFKLDVNGKLKGAARTDKSGQMTIKKLPSHTPALRSLRLLDAHGNVAGSVQF